ncbi:MAG: glutamate 5-kinase, partial [bacterium]
MAGKRLGKTVVVKIGSSTLTDERGALRLGPVAGLVAEVCELQAQGNRMLLVSSGAVSSGMGVLRRRSRPVEVVDLQAAAAVGQGRLFHIYTELFAHDEVVTAQVLLTAFDVAARAQYLNARNTLRRLLEWNVVPIINENDTTSTDELCFGDNDALAAQVALLVKADLLVLLTDTEGLYTADPREDSGARLITTVDDMSELECIRIGAFGPLGSGGMGSKVNSARIATSGGVETVIARGTRPDVLKACLAGEQVGTRFSARALGL